MKSFRSIGSSVNGRMVCKSFSRPPKNSWSVSTEMPEAPACSYPGTIIAGSAPGAIHPLDGERRLNSAMIPVGEVASDCFRLFAGRGGFVSNCRIRKSRDTASSWWAISIRLWATIVCKISVVIIYSWLRVRNFCRVASAFPLSSDSLASATHSSIFFCGSKAWMAKEALISTQSVCALLPSL